MMNFEIENENKKKENCDNNSEKGSQKNHQREDDTPAPDQDTPQNNIDNFGVIGNAFNFSSPIQYLNIIGHIEGHNILPSQNKTTKYEHIIPQLIAVEENPDIKGLLVILNTVGGDVEAGLAISELISAITKPTVSLVLGGGHSIGIPLATSTKYSFIAETATMTLHPIRMNGLVIGAEQTFNYFRKMQERIIDFIIRTSRAERENVIKMMNRSDDIAADIGSVLIGKEAVSSGLIDEVGGLNKALIKLKEMIAENEPPHDNEVTQENGATQENELPQKNKSSQKS